MHTDRAARVAAIVLTLALTLAAVLVMPAPAVAGAGSIAYTDSDGTLSVMTGSGVAVRTLAVGGGEEYVDNDGPAWGPPNQAKLAYWNTSGVPGGRGSGIMIMANANGAVPVSIGEPVPWSSSLWDMRPSPSGPLAWSPSGRYLVYGAYHPDSTPDYSFLVAIDTHNHPATSFTISRTTVAGWRFGGIDFTPDGRNLVICESGTNVHGNQDGRVKKITFSPHSTLLMTYPDHALTSDLSYDGLTVAYSVIGSDANTAIKTCNANTGRERRVVRAGVAGYGPHFSRDKQWIGYSVSGTPFSVQRVPYSGATAPIVLKNSASGIDW